MWHLPNRFNFLCKGGENIHNISTLHHALPAHQVICRECHQDMIIAQDKARSLLLLVGSARLCERSISPWTRSVLIIFPTASSRLVIAVRGAISTGTLTSSTSVPVIVSPRKRSRETTTTSVLTVHFFRYRWCLACLEALNQAETGKNPDRTQDQPHNDYEYNFSFS